MIFSSPYPPIPKLPTQDIASFVFEYAEKHSVFAKNPDLIVLSEGHVSLTYSELRQMTDQVASGLVHKLGLKQKDRLLVLLPNSVYCAPILLGAFAAGLVCVTANPAYTEGELAHLLRLCQPSAIVTAADKHSTVEKAVLSTNNQAAQKRIVIVDEGENGIPLADILCDEDYSRLSIDTQKESEKTPAVVVLSSGTTGQPKGVVLSHSNIISNLLQNIIFEDHDAVVESLSRRAPFQSCVACLPYFHIYGLLLVLLFSIARGRRQIVMPQFDIELFCQLVEKHRIVVAHLVPPVIIQLAKHPAIGRYNLTSLAYIVSGAAPLTHETQREVQKRLNCAVVQAYGMSEASPVTHRASTADVPAGSTGYLLPSMQCKIIDKYGELLDKNKVGEICLRGPNIMAGYYNDPEATNKTVDGDGFLHTGDVGYVDARGCYFILDRKKELIKYKGFQVAPAELEGLLMAHPAVLDAAVISVYSRAQETELPKAFVVLRPEAVNANITRDIVDWVASRVAPYKALRGGVEIVDVVPKSASGKILRRVLRDRQAAQDKLKKIGAKL
ncbi:hypothetical protein FB645_002035 [Coemansia sp. IMI 203386]|nr:hypothetical protein FB645_002035 [Coemansia sp. IMI 203386]